ncbi:MAG: pyridoxal-phosphate-dependent aminotransferase family protein [Methylocystaceae bacterium]
MFTEQQYLMLPGPTPVPPRILRALSQPMINHRGPEFKVLMERVLSGVKQVYQTQNQVVIFPSSGTGVLEATIANFVSRGDQVLAISIGVFGDRFATIAERFGAQVDKLSFPMGQAADPKMVAEKLQNDSRHLIKAVLVTHNETSTGVKNDIKAIRDAMGSHPALLIVDTVSGLGAMEFRNDEWGVDVAASGSQKAFMLPPGLGFMSISPRALEITEQCDNSRYYWDVRTSLEYQAKGQTAVTPPLSIYYGLAEALDMLEAEGIDQVANRHSNYRDMVRAGVKSLGLELLADDTVASSALTAVVAPRGLGSNKIRQVMLDKYNVVLGGGQQHLDNVIFRIGHLGGVRYLDLIAVIAALEMGLYELGLPVKLGSAVAAAQQIMLKM